MLYREIDKINTIKKRERYAVQQVKSFINSDKALEGFILVLYGLRRTGKTTIMEQALSGYLENKCAFYEVQDMDSLSDVHKAIIEAKEKGVEIICLDEITRANDFITNSSMLPDVFAKEGIRIIVTGTDSLCFQFASSNELFDRTVRIQTTYIPLAEHCDVLDTDDIDDYIQYGGLMGKGEPEDRIIHDYNTACKYLYSAVSENIARSLKKNPMDSDLEKLSIEELHTIVEKMVESYSGVFSTQNITSDFIEIINADFRIKTPVTVDMLEAVENYLVNLDVVSATTTINFNYREDLGWRSGKPQHEYHIIQPAIKFNLLQNLQRKLDEKIYGDMLEQIVLFDMSKALNKSIYDVLKPSFYVNGEKKAEFDMLIHDRKQSKYWGFEIKHTTNPFIKQEQHLPNKAFFETLEQNFGNRENVAILYWGPSFWGGSGESGTFYLNVTDFLRSVSQSHDIQLSFNNLTKNLSVQEVPGEPIDQYDPSLTRIIQL